MDSHVRKINRSLVIGWLIIVAVLFVAYFGEVLKGERTAAYLAAFMLATAVPAFICLRLYLREPAMFRLRYYIVVGYFFMYLFSMMTGSTSMVFCYILPMLSFLVLYHQPMLILATGAVSLIINVISLGQKFYKGTMNLSNSKDGEIQMALLILCFGGSYVATKLYDEITNENIAYMKMLDEKNNEIQKMAIQTIATIANTIDAKDEYTKGHSKRVSDYSTAIAKELGMSEKEVMDIQSIALLHDIGKIGVPDSVLNKPGKLTDEEYQLMKQHTVIGGEILKDVGMLPGIDIGAKYHHERYDGKGYPDGLKGEKIPFIARIIAVADAYDAMTSNRIYRKHLPNDKVMCELEEGAGGQFDPKVTKALIRLINEGRLGDISPDNRTEQEIDDAATILSRIIEKSGERTSERMLFDELTGVYNRSAGEKLMQQMLEDYDGCLMFFDIDHFRHINDVAGFLRGDIFLREMVECIRQLEEDMIISRFGSDEFVVLFKNIAQENGAVEVAERFFENIRKKIADNKELEELSVSVGIVIRRRVRESFSSLLLKADKALYFAKQQGGGTYYFYHDMVEKENKNQSNVDLEHLVRCIRDEQVAEEFSESYPETREIYSHIRKIAEENQYRVRLLLLTIMQNDGIKVSVEERERVMGFLERSIVDYTCSTDTMAKYSSTQRIVILADIEEEQSRDAIEHIMMGFYKMYDLKEINVSYDIVDLSKE